MKMFITSCTIVILSSFIINNINAMYADEAGMSDFTISSAGHGYNGGITYAQLTKDGTSILTSSSTGLALDTFSTENDAAADKDHNEKGSSSYDGCYLSSRSLVNGSLNWRRNVCSTSHMTTSANLVRHAVYSNPEYDGNVYTLDEVGVLRVWDETNGNLVNEIFMHDTSSSESPLLTPQLYPLTSLSDNQDELLLGCVFGNQNEGGKMILYDTTKEFKKTNKDDTSETMLLASTMLKNANVKRGGGEKEHTIPQFLAVLNDQKHVVVGYVDTKSSTTTLSQMAIVNISTMEGKSLSGKVPILVSTIKAITNKKSEQLILAVVAGGSAEGNEILVFNTSTRKEVQINKDNLTITDDEKESISKDMMDELESIAKDMNGVIAFDTGYMSCNNKMITIAKGILFQIEYYIESSKSLSIYNDEDQSDITFLKMLQCNNHKMTGLAMSRVGTTSVFEVVFNGVSSSISSMERKWIAEEAFGSISSTTFLDWNSPEGSTTTTNNDDEEEAILASLSFSSRLNAQYESLLSFVSGGFKEQVLNLLPNGNVGAITKSTIGQKDLVFGLKKVAVMLSSPFSKVLGIDTSSKGEIIWSMNLNPKAIWHKVVHGAANSHSSVFGQGMHHPHSPELLILSQLTNNSIEWKCVNGLKGRTMSESQIDLSLPVVQILPIHAHSHAGGGCKQNALLILEDNSFVVVPQTAQSVSDAHKAIESGLYSHTVNKESGLFTTLKLGNKSQQGVVIGETLFDPRMEKIVNIVYPQRNEVVQSPATILGDDSLLLKYLNPHICVIVTEATEEMIQKLENEEKNLFYDALATSSSGSGSEKKQNKKPIGATKPGEEAPSSSSSPKVATPTLFINLVDTVSGQILHRTSHAHVAPGAMLSNDATVPVVISENWIVYAFQNARMRRTELGVITLHEGMIDKAGISAFYTPEQEETFSSLTSAKPFVLTKSYALSVPVSAIGVTNTKNGISSKNILLATGVGGQVMKIDRRLLDPRRPSGEPKETEKKEGLMQYIPLLPTPPMMTQSYTNTIEEVSSIQSTAANLESQTLIIAYGGPDIFFARYAPSKGFDSLPENFNKFAIIMILIALFAALRILKKKGEKKMVDLGWS